MSQWLPRGLEFLSGLPERKRRGRKLLVIQAYIDDSGVKGTDPVFVLAGFIAPADQWAEFSEQWDKHITASPKIDYLKMAEAVKLNGQFRFWRREARDQKLRGCIEILKRFAQRAIHTSVDIDAFQKRMAPHLQKPFSNVYFLMWFTMLGSICFDLLDEVGATDALEVIFDEQVIFGPKVSAWYPAIRESLEFRYPELRGILPPSPMFRNDRDFLPLQAADVLAWLLRTALSGVRTEFEWIATELSPVIKMSQYASVFDAGRMDRIYALSLDVEFPKELISKWRGMLGIEDDDDSDGGKR